MNKFLLLLLLIIIPCLLLFTGILIKEAGGPYYLNYYDPGYVYLVNSINVLQLSTVGHFDHPGTSVQIFGAVILKFLFITRTIDHDTLKEIFSDPEYFLTILNTSMVVINCIALFLLGLLTFKLTKNIYLSLLLQLSPFVSFEIFYGLVIFSPENFLILSCIGVMVLLIFYIYNEKVEKNLTFALVFGFICGFGVVSKMNFLPIFLIPLIIIRGWKYKLIFLVSSLVVFLVILLPVLPDYTSFFTWVKNLVINTGIHGKSGGSDLKVISYFNNIVTIFSKDLIMFIIYLIMVISLFLSYRIKNKEEDEFSAIIKKNRLVLFSIIAAVSFQVLIVAKNYLIYVQYYVIPSLMLLVMGLSVSVSLIYFFLKKKKFVRIRFDHLYIPAIIAISFFGGYKIYNSYYEAVEYRNEAIKINENIRKYSQEDLVIPSIGTANQDCALAITTMYGYGGKNGQTYKEIFSGIVSSKIFFNLWENKFFTIPEDLDTKKIFGEKKNVIVQLTSYTTIEAFSEALSKTFGVKAGEPKLIYRNGNGESIYEIEIN